MPVITEEINVKTASREGLTDITRQVAEAVKRSGVSEGICLVYTPHTTAAVTINENADRDVPADIIRGLASIGIESPPYAHMEGNSPAHIKSSLVGVSETMIITGGRLMLGTWQGIFFCEFDGPRNRKVFIRVTGD